MIKGYDTTAWQLNSIFVLYDTGAQHRLTTVDGIYLLFQRSRERVDFRRTRVFVRHGTRHNPEKSMIRATPFNYPYDGQLRPKHLALVVIDMQVGFLSNNGYFTQMGYDPAPLRAIVPTIARVVDVARAAGCLIVWTRQGYRADLADVSPYDRWRMKRASRQNDRIENRVLRRGDAGFGIVQELAPTAADVIIDKTANSAFCQTDLELVLRSKGITQLILAGCTTDVCVHSTLREASDRKYQCLLIEDACASVDAYAHAAAIHMVTVEDGIHGVVANSVDVIAGLQSLIAPHTDTRAAPRA